MLRQATASLLSVSRRLATPSQVSRLAVSLISRNQRQLQPQYINSIRFNSTKVAQEPTATEETTTPEEPISRSKAPAITPYNYESIKALTANPDPSKVLIDVREPSEYVEGHIPGAINIPYKSTPGALDLSPEEFEEIFKFEKPSKDSELIFYCLAGIRSTAAVELANMFGYEKLGNYTGSYEDWALNQEKEGVASTKEE